MKNLPQASRHNTWTCRPRATSLNWIVLLVALTSSLAFFPIEGSFRIQADELPDWLADFRDPPATYRPQMFWVWNGQVNHERTTEVMEEYARNGVGGVFVHPRPGMITEYLSPDFFDQWEWTLKECKRLGMECHIYDENGFPSGFAGGEVFAADPTLAARYLAPVKITDSRQPLDGQPIAYYVKSGSQSPRSVGKEALAGATEQQPVWALVVKQVEPKPQHGSHPYPDLLRPETCEIFIRATHDRYADLFGKDFADTVKYAFTDEPAFMGGNGYHWSDYLLEEFRREHGYDLRDKLDALCFDTGETTAVRFDYYQTVSRLWIDNFFRPIYQWCDKHHLEFTGHLWEHEWPVPAKQPVVMHTYRWMQAPGTDLLGFQFFPTKFEDQTLAYLNQKETSSVANQLGCRRIMCESCGGGGYGMALREFKPLEDFLLAGGVNVVTPHLSYQTLAGARKYDWPQTISDHSSWWDAYRLQADHVGRVGYALGQGQERNRLLVLHPCTTGWIRYQHKDFALGEQPETDRLQVIGESQQQLLADLHGGQIDFDLGDELTMAELGAVEGNRLRIGQAIYDAVVVPPAMENWTSATLARMEQYLKAGGTVYACARPPAFVDGRTSNKPAELARRYPNQWKQHPTGEQMVAAVRADVPPRISRPDGSPLPLGLCWRRHERPDGTIIYFFCHPWNEPCRTAVRLEGRSLVALDTVKGTAMPVPCRPVEGGQIVTLDLPALGHALLVASPRGGASAPEQPRRELRDLQLASLAVERQAPNVLPLLFCDLQTGDTKAEGVNTTIADELNWKTYGLRGNIWSGSAQFRRTLIDKQFPPDSGFRVTYRFTIDPDALAAVKPSLELAVERPWLYSITVNGKAMDTRDAVRWFDPNIRKMSIEDVIQAGDNRVTLDARPMRSLCEIMPVYVLGDFALEPGETGFTIDKPRKLKMGSWNEQGLPFYADKVAYRYRFSLEQPQENFTIGLPAWSGSVGTIRIDGAKVGVIAWPPDRLEFDRSLSAGEHSLEIIVAGNMKNLMGPHFSDGLPGIWTWRWSGQNTQPAEAYSFAPCGLQKAPVLRGRFESVQ